MFEAILRSEELNKIINENPSEVEIAKIAKNQGLMSLKQDGLIKVLSGVTSLEELSRVIDLGF